MNNSELDSVISYVKNEFGNIKAKLAKRKDLVIQLGNAYEKVVSNPKSICEEIKNTLHDEIVEKLISSRDIERYCPDKWKKKTKPKNDKLSFSNKDNKPDMIVIDQQGNPIKKENVDSNGSSSKAIETSQVKKGKEVYQSNCPKCEKIKQLLDYTIKELQQHDDEDYKLNLTTFGTANIEFSLPIEDVRQYVYENSEPYLPSRPIWFNAKIHLRTGKVIAAYTGTIRDRGHLTTQIKQNKTQTVYELKALETSWCRKI